MKSSQHPIRPRQEVVNRKDVRSFRTEYRMYWVRDGRTFGLDVIFTPEQMRSRLLIADRLRQARRYRDMTF